MSELLPRFIFHKNIRKQALIVTIWTDNRIYKYFKYTHITTGVYCGSQTPRWSPHNVYVYQVNVHFKYLILLLVSYTSIKLKNKTQQCPTIHDFTFHNFSYLWLTSLEADAPPDVVSEALQQPKAPSQCLHHSPHSSHRVGILSSCPITRGRSVSNILSTVTTW